jgi:hypothetical protein
MLPHSPWPESWSVVSPLWNLLLELADAAMNMFVSQNTEMHSGDRYFFFIIIIIIHLFELHTWNQQSVFPFCSQQE